VIPVSNEPTKHCPGATGQEPHTLAVSMFSPDRSRLDGRAPYCRVCAATKQREWKQRNRDKVRAMKERYRGKPIDPVLA
jgi:hypothetical protein